MKKTIKANNPTDYLIVAIDFDNIVLLESNGKQVLPSGKDIRIGIFKVVQGKGYITIFPDNLGKTGELTIKLNDYSSKIDSCFFDDDENGKIFEIISGADTIKVSYSPDTFSLSYDEVQTENESSGSGDIFDYYYNDTCESELKQVAEKNEEKKLTLIKENETIEKNIEETEKEIELIKKEHDRLVEKAEKIRLQRKAAQALLEENGQIEREEEDLSDLMTRHGIGLETLTPYLDYSPTLAAEAKEHLDKAFEIIKKLILDKQEEVNNTTLPDNKNGGEDNG